MSRRQFPLPDLLSPQDRAPSEPLCVSGPRLEEGSEVAGCPGPCDEQELASEILVAAVSLVDLVGRTWGGREGGREGEREE